jgi:hypothetical protein
MSSTQAFATDPVAPQLGAVGRRVRFHTDILNVQSLSAHYVPQSVGPRFSRRGQRHGRSGPQRKEDQRAAS